jgi:hypothetical protein
MPFVTFRSEIHAPATLVWAMMKEKIEHPEKYVPGVEKAEIVRRPSDRVVERVMQIGQGERAMVVRELISFDDSTMTVFFKLLDDPKHVGFVTNTVFDENGRVELDYTMNWVPKSEAPAAAGPDWQAMLRGAVLHAKELAEKGG